MKDKEASNSELLACILITATLVKARNPDGVVWLDGSLLTRKQLLYCAQPWHEEQELKRCAAAQWIMPWLGQARSSPYCPGAAAAMQALLCFAEPSPLHLSRSVPAPCPNVDNMQACGLEDF
jgi:hypothetical protein